MPQVGFEPTIAANERVIHITKLNFCHVRLHIAIKADDTTTKHISYIRTFSNRSAVGNLTNNNKTVCI